MKKVHWSRVKSERLKKTRGVSFEDILEGELLDVLEHPKRRNQRILVYSYRKYVWAVPFIEEGETIFLKTIFPSRKLAKRYERGR